MPRIKGAAAEFLAKLMTAPAETALADDPLRVVAQRMVDNRLKHLAVINTSRQLLVHR